MKLIKKELSVNGNRQSKQFPDVILLFCGFAPSLIIISKHAILVLLFYIGN